MNRTIGAAGILILLAVFIGVHTAEIHTLSRDIAEICDDIEDAMETDDWNLICTLTDKLGKRWDKSRFWASMTIKTDKTEEIEISIRQSNQYAHLHAKEDFAGEFCMLRHMAEHLKKQEGLAAEELL